MTTGAVPAFEKLAARADAHLAALRQRLDAVPDRVLHQVRHHLVQALGVAVDGEVIPMPLKEFELLELLARNPGKVFSRFEIEEKVWPEYTGGSNVVDVYIGYLRRKLEEGGERRLIHTVRGVGYVLREE